MDSKSNSRMIRPDWTLDDFARHYAEVVNGRPNGWGQYVSPYFGQSHGIMHAATMRFGERETNEAFTKAVTGV